MADRYSIEDFFRPAFCFSLELGFAGDDAHAIAALAALRSCHIVEGSWSEPGDIGQTALHGDTATSRFGLLTSRLAENSLPFRVSLIREQHAQPQELTATLQEIRVEFGVQTQQPSDRVTLDIPVSTLAALWAADITWAVASRPSS